MEKEIRPHSFSYDGGIISATGIKNIKEFGEHEISAELDNNSLIIRGNGLKITDFNSSSGNLKISGELLYMQYGVGSASFFKRLLK